MMSSEEDRPTQRRVSWHRLGSPRWTGRYSVEGLGNIIFVSQRHIELARQYGEDCIVTLVLGSANPGIKEWIIWKIEPAATTPAEAGPAGPAEPNVPAE